jgi:hypothetical protein
VTRPQKVHPDVRALVPRFLAHYRKHGTFGGALHVCLDDGNWNLPPDAESLLYARDDEECELARIVCELSESQRARLVELVQEAERARYVERRRP